MDIFSLRCYLMVAEQLNFTKTAYIMNVSQPSLSRIINNLENELNVMLVCRTKQGVTLTEAGKEFVKHAHGIVRDYDLAVKRTKEVDKRVAGQVCIGFLPAMCSDIIPNIVKKVRQEYFDIELDVIPLAQDDIISALNVGAIDIGLMLDWKIDKLVNCNKEIFFQDEYKIALHKDHRFANRESVSLDDIRDELCLFYKNKGDLRIDDDNEIGALATFYQSATMNTLNHTKQVPDLLGLLTLISCNMGIGLLPRHIERFCSDSIKFVDIYPMVHGLLFNGVFCWNKNSPASFIKKMRKIITEPGL
ncbi:MAG: LysR family transcriptional regulator [Eubacterium sp.]|nr:LysR family transcriptional regulator [Eubacterium sp.]